MTDDKYRTAVDAAAIYSETDLRGTITHINDQFCAISGYTKEELIGTNHRLLNSGQHPPEFFRTLWRTISSGHIWKGEICNRRKDGSLYWVNSTIVPIKDDLAQHVEKYISIRFDVTEKQELLEAMRWRASHDVLTALPNRVYLHDRLHQAISAAQRHGRSLAVCILDLDGFKAVNDRYGHATGDLLLVEVANRLTRELRTEDLLARLGGDEFVLLLDQVNETLLPAALQRVLDVIAVPFHIDGYVMKVAGSLGVTIYPQDNEGPDTLLRHADQAMYEAKQSGRNRFRFFDVSISQKTQEAFKNIESVKQALENNELRLHYQPKVNLRNGMVIGFEALLRWQHPALGLLPPDAFLPAVERTDVIIDIGDWVIEQTLCQLRIWNAEGHHWPTSVNIAARHFQLPNFVDRLQRLLAKHSDVEPRLLDLEIVESTAIDNLEHVSQCLIDCQQMGVTFSLDDFGTGFSSLNYLKRLPAQTIKIDKSFVRDILHDKDDLALSEAIINLSRTFEREVIAEGVETDLQEKMLLAMGCYLVQGYGIAPPMPAEQVSDWATLYELTHR
ncbi:putative bifunctional diguanylate cyclase/phosphodiesterase [Stutzerimonas zhaodongensis]|jgi:diguanylate cyclase (GGDEF)-like protein/PAS domain S-box-containing protein|uniref:EAL domain-containing protein n=1 Tax=Stutzerimonas zhaodongensis TaxID=1176257 RepID=A0A365PRJ3_9GAMM|nr:EAL domain-containing protein [Stutzerimonas zhaodongensis]QWV15890.1 EAL domain-containing protein [Stutzerimonas zhaodongensis]RBA54220.1 GGDEF domain-containing protein [Stutzerimonas zhaodongensis]